MDPLKLTGRCPNDRLSANSGSADGDMKSVIILPLLLLSWFLRVTALRDVMDEACLRYDRLMSRAASGVNDAIGRMFEEDDDDRWTDSSDVGGVLKNPFSITSE